ncbi:MAG: hypothetical protein AAGE96_09475 [Cyanobacteria bacterium P01_G01_bin.19]
MKLLLDTCCWLWWLSDTDKLSQQQLNLISDKPNGMLRYAIVNYFYPQQVSGK